MVVVIETGRKTAFLAYIAVALMCVMLLPNIVIAMEFALLFGYYPIIKMWLDDIGRTFVRRVVKLTIFLIFAVVSLFISIHVLGIAITGQMSVYIAIPLGQITIFCIVNDYLLGHIHQHYTTKLRPIISRGKK